MQQVRGKPHRARAVVRAPGCLPACAYLRARFAVCGAGTPPPFRRLHSLLPALRCRLHRLAAALLLYPETQLFSFNWLCRPQGHTRARHPAAGGAQPRSHLPRLVSSLAARGVWGPAVDAAPPALLGSRWLLQSERIQVQCSATNRPLYLATYPPASHSPPARAGAPPATCWPARPATVPPASGTCRTQAAAAAGACACAGTRRRAAQRGRLSSRAWSGAQTGRRWPLAPRTTQCGCSAEKVRGPEGGWRLAGGAGWSGWLAGLCAG